MRGIRWLGAGGVLAAFIFLLAGPVNAVTVGSGVQANLTGNNSVITYGTSMTFDNVTMFQNAVRLDTHNLTVSSETTEYVNATLWMVDLTVDTQPAFEIEAEAPAGNNVTFQLTDVPVIQQGNWIVQVDDTQLGTDDGGTVTWQYDNWGENHNFSLIPNTQPTIELTDTVPSAPAFGDEVEVFANVSDPEHDTIVWANFTIWESNEDQETVLVDNQNGSLSKDGQYWVWTADTITADLENGTYNWTVETADPWATTEQTGQFTLEEVSPNVSEPHLKLFNPWNVEASEFRPDQTIEITANIVDLNGRTDLAGLYANISSPSGLEASYLELSEDALITNGFETSRIYDLADAEQGAWTVTVFSVDEQGLVGSNNTSFKITTYDNVTLRHTVDMTGSVETRMSDFEYVMADGAPALTGIINYDGFLTQDAENTGVYELSMTQSFEDNRFILPYTAASINELDALQEEFSASLVGGRSFLDYNIASIAYGLHDELDVTVELSYFDTDRIYLSGFNRSLAQGQHQLVVRNAGTENGATIVEVQR